MSRPTSTVLATLAAAALVAGPVTAASAAPAVAKPAAAAKAKAKKAKKRRAARKPAAATAPAAAAPAVAPSGVRVHFDGVGAGTFKATADLFRPTNTSALSATGFGEFRATGVEFGPKDLIEVAGPTTCLEANGKDVGLFYPVKEARPIGAMAGTTGIYVWLHDGGPGGQDLMGFLPAPITAVQGCSPAPLVAMLPVTSGDVTIDES